MFDVDALTRRFLHLIIFHIDIAALLNFCDRAKRTCAYAATEFSNLGNVKITETDNPSSNPPPFLTSDILQRFFKIASLIQPQPLYYSPPHLPLSQHFLFICAHTLTSAQFRFFATLSHQTLQCPP